MLDLIRISRTEMGAYLCIAVNGVPPAVSKRIILTVECKTKLLMGHVQWDIHKKEGKEEPCKRYLQTFMESVKFLMWSFPYFFRGGGLGKHAYPAQLL